MIPPEGFEAAAADLGLAFDPGDLERLGGFLALLLETNKVVNLTAVKDADEAWTRHVLDSLALVPIIASAAEEASIAAPTLIDVGTGGGLPGIVLAIAIPSLRVTLLDATEKKCRFLEHAAKQLGLTNISVVHARAERAGHERGRRIDEAGTTRHEGALRESFDFVTARAVGRLATLLELTVPFAKPGGLCVLIKGEKAAEELSEAKAAMHLLHAASAGDVRTPTGTVVVIEKLRQTPRV